MALKELLAQKRADLAAVTKEATDLRDAHPDGFADESKAAEFRGKLDTTKALRADVEKLEAELKGALELDEINDWLDEPQRTIPLGGDAIDVANGEASGRKALVRRGWELKGEPGEAAGGIWHAPTASGTLQPMYPDEVLFGAFEAMESDDERKYAQAARAVFNPRYRPTFIKALRMAAKNAGGDAPWLMAYTALDGEERKALSEGQDTAGGFLVPADAQAEMLQRVAARAVMYGLARVVTTSRDEIKWPRVQAHATSGSIYSSGFVGSMSGEMPAFTEVDPSFGEFKIAIKKARAATKLGIDFVNDAASNVLAWMARNGAENLALVLEDQFINGTGAGVNILGLLNGGATTVDVEGSTANTISNTIAATGSAPKILNLEYALPEQYLGNAQWLMRRAIEGDIRQLVDAQARFLWGGVGLNAGNRNELDGYPLNRSPFMPNDGADGNKVLVFGDFSSYVIATRAQIAFTVLNERFADNDQIGVIVSSRTGGALENEDAIRVGVV